MAPLIYKNLLDFYKLIEKTYDVWIYKKNYDINFFLNFFLIKDIKNKKKIYIFFFNQLILEYFFNSIIYLYLIINWLWITAWNKWGLLKFFLKEKFLNIKSIFQYINNFFYDFMNYNISLYNDIIYGYFFDLDFMEYSRSIYNFFLFNSLELFYVLFNFEKIKLEHERVVTLEKNWKNIREVKFNYLNIDLLNNYFNLSFFSFSIYEFYILKNQYNVHFLSLTFFEYWTNVIIEKNYKEFLKKKKNNDYFKFNNFFLKNIDNKIYKKNFFSVRLQYNFFLSNVDYYFFFKNFLYNFYIRNCVYFFEFISQRKFFLIYNNPTGENKGSLTIWNYDKLLKTEFFLKGNNLNEDSNLFKANRIEPFFNFYDRKNKKNLKWNLNLFFRNFNIRFLYKLENSRSFYTLIQKFFFFNLIDIYDLKNKLESYKEVMAIKSVYEYRFANNSFRTMEEFLSMVFQTPLENFLFFNEFYKNLNYIVIFNIFTQMDKNYFFFDLFNSYNKKYLKNYLNLIKFFTRLFKVSNYFFKNDYLFYPMKNDENENLLKIEVFSKYYEKLEKKKFFF